MEPSRKKRFSDATLKRASGFVIVSTCVGFLLLFLTQESSESPVRSIVIFVLLVFLAASLMALIRLTKYIQDREEEIADVRSDFVAVASHELRSPLSAVRWYLAELRGDATLSQDARKIVNDLYERICSLIDLTTTFLLMTNADHAPLQASNVKTVDIAPNIRAAVTAAISTARSKNIKVSVQAPLDGQIVVKADPVRLRIVFDNLLSNAIKYSHEGSTVSLSYEDVGGAKRFSVHDMGIGVPKNEIDRIFSGYHRAANARRSGKLGSGFGLYMAKKIVDMHGGSLTCESSPENGTTFVVTLPPAA